MAKLSGATQILGPEAAAHALADFTRGGIAKTFGQDFGAIKFGQQAALSGSGSAPSAPSPT